MILVTGASGGVGSAVLEEVHKTGSAFKAMYRSDEDARNAPAGVTTVIADFSDMASLKRAFSGVDAVFLVCSPIPDLVKLEGNAIEACKESGVKHVVLNSAVGAQDYPKSFPSWHGQVENKLKASGLGYTILQPNSFMQNILAFYAPSIREQGAFYAAMGTARMSYLDARDIARVAAKALTFPAQHAGRTYELNGPEAVSYSELAERISRAAGRAIRYVDIPDEAQRKSMLDLGMPLWQVDALLDLQHYYTQLGKGGAVTDVLAGLLGAPPKRLDSFLEEYKDAFRANG